MASLTPYWELSDYSEPFSRTSELCLDGQITNRSKFPVASGGTSDIWTGCLGTHMVSIKVIRPFSSSGARIERSKLVKRLWREYLAWSSLSHPNILECRGFSYDFTPEGDLPALISSWMPNGNAVSYISSYPHGDRFKVILGIAEGISYLHSRDPVVVHGDIRGGNILVSDTGDPCLIDFGISRMFSDIRGLTTSSELAGSLRWMSPELLSGENLSVNSDIWAFGMTIVEIFSGARPYSELKSEPVVMGQIMDGVTPSRPAGITNRLWTACKRCWNLQPGCRPSMREIILELTEADGPYSHSIDAATVPPEISGPPSLPTLVIPDDAARQARAATDTQAQRGALAIDDHIAPSSPDLYDAELLFPVMFLSYKYECDEYSPPGSPVSRSRYLRSSTSPASASGGGLAVPDVNELEAHHADARFDARGDGGTARASGAEEGQVRLNMMNPPRKPVVTKAIHNASSSTRENPVFGCSVPGCGSTFTRSLDLTGHLRLHMEARSFKCKQPGCEEIFAQQADCKQHEALHYPYTCVECKKTFARAKALSRHRQRGCAGCQQLLVVNPTTTLPKNPSPITTAGMTETIPSVSLSTQFNETQSTSLNDDAVSTRESIPRPATIDHRSHTQDGRRSSETIKNSPYTYLRPTTISPPTSWEDGNPEALWATAYSISPQFSSAPCLSSAPSYFYDYGPIHADKSIPRPVTIDHHSHNQDGSHSSGTTKNGYHQFTTHKVGGLKYDVR